MAFSDLLFLFFFFLLILTPLYLHKPAAGMSSHI